MNGSAICRISIAVWTRVCTPTRSSASRSASACSTSGAEYTRSYPEANAWQIVEVARMTSMTIPVGASPAAVGVNATSIRTRVR
jgi:hypothetical protein